jgi:hypothetical protein
MNKGQDAAAASDEGKESMSGLLDLGGVSAGSGNSAWPADDVGGMCAEIAGGVSSRPASAAAAAAAGRGFMGLQDSFPAEPIIYPYTSALRRKVISIKVTITSMASIA